MPPCSLLWPEAALPIAGQRAIIAILIPIVLTLLACLAAAACNMFVRHRGTDMTLPLSTVVFVALATSLNLFYPSMAESILSLFVCRTIDVFPGRGKVITIPGNVITIPGKVVTISGA